MRWMDHVARMGEVSNAYRTLLGKPEGKRPLGRPRRRWEDNIKVDFSEVSCGVVSYGSGRGPVAGSCEIGNEPSVFIKGR
jgi:hypothetical protein